MQNCYMSHFHKSIARDASSPRVTASLLLLNVKSGSSGPGGGLTTNGEEGADLQSTVGGYWAPDEGGVQDWINWKKIEMQKISKQEY